MLIRYVKMTFQEDKVDEFLNIFEIHKQKIKQFPGCSYMEVLRDIHAPNIFMTHSHWDSEADLNKYRDSELFAYVWENTKKLFADKPIAFSMESFMIV